MDVADPSLAVGTGTRVEGGLFMQHMLALLRVLRAAKWTTFEMVSLILLFSFRFVFIHQRQQR